MLPAERKRTIVQLVTERDGCSVAVLADELEFSKATIRRDLRDLEAEGRIERSHGGAVPASSVGTERSYDQREVERLDAKQAIAARASDEIRDGQVVFFDAGTTTMEVARAAPDSGYVAATNMPELAMELSNREVEVKSTGGTLRARTKALVGPTAESFLERTNFDLLFLGTNALDAEAGLSTPNEDEAEVKRQMVEQAGRVVLVADSSKFGERSFVSFADLDDVDMVVTDGDLPSALADAFAEADVVVEGVST
ncbi:DeoR/GlpR family DNA-binding transcription regulator [Halomicroarcula sp. F13]|uniref:DeoR/GlpR family DNA-binding transcription regulator n=1 Tax=Haloarcula rubra TaxID=2487747 RepID=A0AAW4PRA7_9EURY|nr:HTH-type transcriptional regulator GlpR [Halomicroarcula rubra]MBX0323538.1 DeoR/GlpR family DNA-binding transcription regulator [Halomicroarcula rubra]